MCGSCSWDELTREIREEEGIPRRCSWNDDCYRLYNSEFDCEDCENN